MASNPLNNSFENWGNYYPYQPDYWYAYYNYGNPGAGNSKILENNDGYSGDKSLEFYTQNPYVGYAYMYLTNYKNGYAYVQNTFYLSDEFAFYAKRTNDSDNFYEAYYGVDRYLKCLIKYKYDGSWYSLDSDTWDDADIAKGSWAKLTMDTSGYEGYEAYCRIELDHYSGGMTM